MYMADNLKKRKSNSLLLVYILRMYANFRNRSAIKFVEYKLSNATTNTAKKIKTSYSANNTVNID